MLFIIPPKRSHRRVIENPEQTTPLPPLTLIAAEYEEASTVTLTFDRAIDVSAMLVDSVTVRDVYFTGHALSGAGVPNLILPTRVRIPLVAFEKTSGSGVKLTVDASNGIVAVDDGSAWDGVSGLELPFEG